MSREVIEKYQDVLQNIEFSIVDVYKRNPTDEAQHGETAYLH